MSFFIALRKPELDESVTFTAVPFGFAYEPKTPDIAFIPGLDDHEGTGAVPGLVNVAHRIVLGVQEKVDLPGVYWVEANAYSAVKSTMAIPQLKPYYPAFLKGWVRSGQEENGDWVVDLKTFQLRRVPMNDLAGLFAA